MITVYGFKTFNLNKVLLTLEEANTDYTLILLNAKKGEHKTPEHIKRHPLGKVPATEHNGKYLFESGAICRYVANISESDLYAGDNYNKAVIDEWVDCLTQHPGRWMGTIFFNEYAKPKLMNKEPDQEVLKEAYGFLKKQLPALDKQLSANEFIAGSNLTIADTIGFAYAQLSEVTNVSIDEHTNIKRWYEDMCKRDSVQKIREHLM